MQDKLENFKVTDRKTFSEFLSLLHDDYIKDPERWENKSLPDFLEALSRYTNDIQGYYDNTNQNISADEARWQTIADIFMGARIYE